MDKNTPIQQVHKSFPWKHVVGYILSMVLTVFAVWVAFDSALPSSTISILIYVLAFLQAALQLLMFMHMTETANANLQTGTILFALFIAIIVVTGSVWVMSSGHT